MAKRKPQAEPTEGTTLEAAMGELSEIVSRLESGQETLDDSLAQFERGMTLLRICHRQLDTASQRIELVTQISPEGDVVTEDFDATSTLERNAGSEIARKTRRGTKDEGDDAPLLF